MGVIGLDYTEARKIARDLDIQWTYGLLRKLQVLEYLQLKRISGDDTDHSAGDGHGE